MNDIPVMQSGVPLTLVLIDKFSGRQVVIPPEQMFYVEVRPEYNNGGNFLREAPVVAYDIQVTADFLGAFQRAADPMRELQQRPQIGGAHD